MKSQKWRLGKDKRSITLRERGRKLFKVVSSPRLAWYLLNAQLQMARGATVPVSVRLRGRARVHGRGHIIIGERAILVGTVVPIELTAHEGGKLIIGEQTFINYGASISAHESVTIGARCKIGHYAFVMDNNQHDMLDRTRLPQSSPVAIEDDVWIGAHVVVLPGVRIGRNAVVGAGSVVKQDVPANGLVAGNPARLVRMLPVSG